MMKSVRELVDVEIEVNMYNTFRVKNYIFQ